MELTGKDLIRRVLLLTQLCTLFTFNYTRRGLLDTHKLTLTTMLCLRILVRIKSVSAEVVNGLVRAPPDVNAASMPDSARSWITEITWQQLKTLEAFPTFKSVSGALT